MADTRVDVDEEVLRQGAQRARAGSRFVRRALGPPLAEDAVAAERALIDHARTPWDAARLAARLDALIAAASNAPTSNAPTSNAPTSNAPTSNAPTSNAPTSNARTPSVPTPGAPTVADASPEVLAVALRRLRREALLGLIVRDVAGVAALAEVTTTMTQLAELAVQRLTAALARELAMLHGVPLGADGTPQDLLVVAMGKGGGGELNVSSDLDLIYVYDSGGETAPQGA
ncbi:MAG: hypothetical protein MUC68_05715, partial [Burkholderiaceae bacterium]|nr:hypothetical protein [Burkholderiaceae bacterium]